MLPRSRILTVFFILTLLSGLASNFNIKRQDPCSQKESQVLFQENGVISSKCLETSHQISECQVYTKDINIGCAKCSDKYFSAEIDSRDSDNQCLPLSQYMEECVFYTKGGECLERNALSIDEPHHVTRNLQGSGTTVYTVDSTFSTAPATSEWRFIDQDQSAVANPATSDIVVVDVTTVNNNPGAGTNGVELFDDENLCVIQNLPILPPGDYTLRYSIGPNNVAGGFDLAQSDYQVFIRDIDGTDTILDSGVQSFATEDIRVTRNDFNLVVSKEGYTVFICNVGTADPNYGAVVFGIQLQKNGDGCPVGESTQTLTDGSLACIPNQNVVDNPNCDRFVESSVAGTFICGSCPAAVPNLVELTSAPVTRACAQVIIPGTADYIVNTALEVDANGFLIITNTACLDAAFTTEVLDIEGNTEGVACIADATNSVASWSIVGGQYSILTCTDATATAITLTDGTGACLAATDDFFDANCQVYEFDGVAGTYECDTCAFGFEPLDAVEDGAGAARIYCIATGEIRFGCDVHDFNTADGIFYCDTCTAGYDPIPVTAILPPQFEVCTTLSLIATCDIYEIPAESDTNLQCASCATAGQEPLCVAAGTCPIGQQQIQIVAATPDPACVISNIIEGCVLYASAVSAGAAGDCVQCNDGLSLALVNNTFSTPICIDEANVVIGCLRYSNVDNSICEVCESGQAFDEILRICPGSDGNADALINNCAQVEIEGTAIKCIRCQAGFDLDFRLNRCLVNVMFCASYDDAGACQRCISGYELDLVNNVCNREGVGECQSFDSNGECAVCAGGFNLVDGVCIQTPTCTSTQYLNSQNVCVEGNFPNCGQFNSNGVCLRCADGFSFTLNLDACVAQQVIECPDDTATQTYVVINGQCVATDINCAIANFDGSCAVCDQGYYSSGGVCFAIGQINQQQGGQDEFDFLFDSRGWQYLLNADGSRTYFSGSVSGLTVFADQNDDLYLQNNNGSRTYLTGQFEGRTVQLDADGYFYAANNDGSRSYLNGPYAGQTVFLDQALDFYLLNSDGSRTYLTGPYQGQTVFVDSQGSFFIRNGDGSVTFLTGPYQGQTLFMGPGEYLYRLNPDGSRFYITGPWANQTVFEDENGFLYILRPDGTWIFVSGPNENRVAFPDDSGFYYLENPDGSRFYLTGPNRNSTLFLDPAGYLYILNPDNSRTYVSGPFNGRTLFIDPSGYLYILNPNGTREYVSGPFVGRIVSVEPGTGYLFVLNPNGSRLYLTGPSANQTIFSDPDGSQYRLNPDGTRFYLTGPLTGQTVFTDPSGFLYVLNPDGSRLYVTGPNSGRTVLTDPTNGLLYYLNPSGQRIYLTGPNAGQPISVDPTTGNQFIVNPDDTTTFLTGPNAGQTTEIDPTTGNQFIRQPDGSLVFVDGPNAGQNTQTDPTTGEQFVTNPDGSVTFLTGPNAGQTTQTGPNGEQFIVNPDGSVTYLTGPNVGETVLVDPVTGQQFIQNPDGSITFVTGPNQGQTVVTDPSGNQYIQNPDGTRTYVSGPNSGTTFFVDPSGNIYTINSDGTRNYPLDPNGQNNFPAPTTDDIVNNLLDGNAQIRTGGNGQTFIVYTDPTGRTFATLVDEVVEGGYVFTDSNGVEYFISSIEGSLPVRISRDAQGNRFYIGSNGQRIFINEQVGPIIDPVDPVDPVDPTLSDNVQIDEDGFQFTIIDGIKTYLTGPNAGLQAFVDQNGDEYCQKPDGSRSYISGPFKGYVGFPDDNGFFYIQLPNGNRQYITGPNVGRRIFIDNQGNFYTVPAQNTRSYIDGPYVGSLVFVDPEGYLYTIDPLSNIATYINGPFEGRSILRDANGRLFRIDSNGRRLIFSETSTSSTDGNVLTDSEGYSYRLNPLDGTRTYINGPHAGQTVMVDMINSGYIYVTNPDGSRRYLNGPYQNESQGLFADPLGNLYRANADGTRTYVTGPQSGRTVLVDIESYLYVLNSNGTRTYLSGPLNGRTVNVDSDGYLYLLNPNGSRTYLSGPNNGRTVMVTENNQGQGNQGQMVIDDQNSIIPSGGNLQITIIYTDDQGRRYNLNFDGSRNYLQPAAGSDPTATTQRYTDAARRNYLVYRDPTTGNLYSRNSDGSRNYLTGFAPEPETLSGLIVQMDNLNQEYFIYSDSQGNRYVVYEDARGNQYYRNSAGQRVPIDQNIIGSDRPGALQPDVEYELYTDASENMYLLYTDETDGRKYTIDENNNRRYLEDGQGVTPRRQDERIFMDVQGRRFVIDEDGSRRYLSVNRDIPAGSNYVNLIDTQGNEYRVYTDPQGNQYVLFGDGTRHYITGLSNQIGDNFMIVRDVLGNEYTVFTVENGNTYTTYEDPTTGMRYFFNPDGSRVNIGMSQNNGTGQGGNNNDNTPSDNISSFVFMDQSGNRYVIDPQTGNPTFISLAPGSTSNSNPATYRDSRGNNYLIYTDANRNRYTRNPDGTRNYMTGYPATEAINPRTLVDGTGMEYFIVSDEQRNNYVTYEAPNARYYLSPIGQRVFIDEEDLPEVVDNQGGVNVPATPTTPTIPTQPTQPTSTVGILYADPSGNRYMINPRTLQREYLCSGDSSTQSPQYTNSGTGEQYPAMIDPTTGNQYIMNQPDNTRIYLNGYPSQPVGQPAPVRDALGDLYYVERDPQGNRYVTYVDDRGRYYLDRFDVPRYLRGDSVPGAVGATEPRDTPEWDLIRELQEKLASCGGSN